MKTNQNMTRKLGDLKVIQRTKDGMFNATKLLKQWNQKPGNPKRDLSKFWENTKVKEFLAALSEEEILHTPNQGYVKSRASRGVNAGTWMHPYLFIKFAMWLNPRFEVQVIRFVYDELIKFRHQAGDHYRPFCSAVGKIHPNCDYSEPAKWLNYIVFNSHERDIRNKATQEQLGDMSKLQKKYTDLIEEGYISDLPTLKDKLRAEWRKRHDRTPNILSN